MTTPATITITMAAITSPTMSPTFAPPEEEGTTEAEVTAGPVTGAEVVAPALVVVVVAELPVVGRTEDEVEVVVVVDGRTAVVPVVGGGVERHWSGKNPEAQVLSMSNLAAKKAPPVPRLLTLAAM